MHPLSSTVQKLGPTEVELQIRLSQEEISSAEERAFKKLSRNAKVPGFRPGKLPRKIFEQQYGTSIINSRAMEEVVPDAYRRAIREHNLEPVERPQMELVPAEDGNPVTIKAKVSVRPTISLGEYRGLATPAEPQAISDQEVERSLRALAHERATLVPVDRPAKVGDYVVVDYVGSIDGVPFDGGKAEGQTTELSEDRFIPGFARGITGMSSGQSKDVHAHFPPDYSKQELADKKAIFAVTLHEVKEVELPPIDDEFAKAVSGSESVWALKDDIRRRLAAVARSKARKALGDQIMDKLLETHEFALPTAMVDREIESMLGDARSFAGRMGVGWDDYLNSIHKTEAELRADFRPDAEKRVKGTLLIEAIGKAENIHATPADVAAELQSLAEQYGQPSDRIRQALGNNVLSLMDGIVRSKTMDWLIEQSEVGAATSAPVE